MQRRTVHQWRDWLLEYIGDNNYELIKQETLIVTTLTAKDYMDAENQSQLIIKNTKGERA
jgi:hypothetical protein